MKEKLQLIKHIAPADPLDAWDSLTGEPVAAVTDNDAPAIEIECVLTGPQPLKGSEIELLEQGERNKLHFKFYTYYQDISAGKRSTGEGADLIVWQGVRYKVVQVFPYTTLLKHRKVIIKAYENET